MIFSSRRRSTSLLQGVAGDEVENEHLARLADAVDPADALLDRHRIPGHIEVDERVAELDIAALAAELGAKKHRHAVAEPAMAASFSGPLMPPSKHARANPSRQQVGEMRRASRGNGRTPVFFSAGFRRSKSSSAVSLPPVPVAAQRSRSAGQPGSSGWRPAKRHGRGRRGR